MLLLTALALALACLQVKAEDGILWDPNELLTGLIWPDEADSGAKTIESGLRSIEETRALRVQLPIVVPVSSMRWSHPS